MVKYLIALISLLLVIAQGCKDDSTSSGSPSPAGLDESDPEIRVAITNAQNRLNDFIGALRAPQPNQQRFFIKAKLVEGNRAEHVWVSNVSFDGRVFRGVIAEPPKTLAEHSVQQPVLVPVMNVSDWMYVQDGKLVGGYTSRVLRNRMTEEERQSHDAALPYKFE